MLPDAFNDAFPPSRAGITGLQTALHLLDAGYQVTIVAEYVPGDESAHYASPWYIPISSRTFCFRKSLYVELALGIVVDPDVGPELNGEVMPKHMRQIYSNGMQRHIRNGWLW